MDTASATRPSIARSSNIERQQAATSSESEKCLSERRSPLETVPLSTSKLAFHSKLNSRALRSKLNSQANQRSRKYRKTSAGTFFRAPASAKDMYISAYCAGLPRRSGGRLEPWGLDRLEPRNLDRLEPPWNHHHHHNHHHNHHQ